MHDRALGATEYSGEDRERDGCIAEDVPAAIQLKKESLTPEARLPGDAARRSFWTILIPRGGIEVGTIRIRDVIEDDARQRYQVIAPYLTGFGYSLLVELLDL